VLSVTLNAAGIVPSANNGFFTAFLRNSQTALERTPCICNVDLSFPGCFDSETRLSARLSLNMTNLRVSCEEESPRVLSETFMGDTGANTTKFIDR
jgi:hypothetical protein